MISCGRGSRRIGLQLQGGVYYEEDFKKGFLESLGFA